MSESKESLIDAAGLFDEKLNVFLPCMCPPMGLGHSLNQNEGKLQRTTEQAEQSFLLFSCKKNLEGRAGKMAQHLCSESLLLWYSDSVPSPYPWQLTPSALPVPRNLIAASCHYEPQRHVRWSGCSSSHMRQNVNAQKSK